MRPPPRPALRHLSRLSVAAVLVFVAAGCARYDYDIVDPPDLAQRVERKGDTLFRTDAAEYRFRTVDNRLVVRIYNVGDESMTLAGGRSAVVDPEGQSHPLVTQTIEPGSYIRLIFPPPRPTLERRTGPSFHFGVGARYGHYHRRGFRTPGRYAYYDPFYYDDDVEPRYYRVYDDANPIYWDWRGEGQMRLRLVFERGGETIEDRFVIARRKT
jgi:hypothetical protein